MATVLYDGADSVLTNPDSLLFYEEFITCRKSFNTISENMLSSFTRTTRTRIVYLPST